MNFYYSQTMVYSGKYTLLLYYIFYMTKITQREEDMATSHTSPPALEHAIEIYINPMTPAV